MSSQVTFITRHIIVIEESSSEVGAAKLSPFESRRFNKGTSPSGIRFPEELTLSTEIKDAEQARKIAIKANAYYADLLKSGKWECKAGSATLHPVEPKRPKK